MRSSLPLPRMLPRMLPLPSYAAAATFPTTPTTLAASLCSEMPIPSFLPLGSGCALEHRRRSSTPSTSSTMTDSTAPTPSPTMASTPVKEPLPPSASPEISLPPGSPPPALAGGSCGSGGSNGGARGSGSRGGSGGGASGSGGGARGSGGGASGSGGASGAGGGGGAGGSKAPLFLPPHAPGRMRRRRRRARLISHENTPQETQAPQSSHRKRESNTKLKTRREEKPTELRGVKQVHRWLYRLTSLGHQHWVCTSL